MFLNPHPSLCKMHVGDCVCVFVEEERWYLSLLDFCVNKLWLFQKKVCACFENKFTQHC